MSATSGLIQIDDTSPTISYSTGWFGDLIVDDKNFNKTLHQNYSAQDKVDLNADIHFSGSSISVLVTSWFDHGRVYCSLTSSPEYPWSWFNSSYPSAGVAYNLTLCSLTGIPAGNHTLRIGRVLQDYGYLNVDSYILDTQAEPGTSPVWRSSFPTVDPAPGYSTTTQFQTTSSSATSSPTGTSLATASTSSAKSGKSPNSVAIGVGVAVGIAGLLALAAVFFFFKRSRKAVTDPGTANSVGDKTGLASPMSSEHRTGSASGTDGSRMSSSAGRHTAVPLDEHQQQRVEHSLNGTSFASDQNQEYLSRPSFQDHSLQRGAQQHPRLEDPGAFAPR